MAFKRGEPTRSTIRQLAGRQLGSGPGAGRRQRVQQSCHTTDIIRYLAGSEPRRLRASGGKRTWTEERPEEEEFQLEKEAFIGALREGWEPELAVHDGQQAVRQGLPDGTGTAGARVWHNRPQHVAGVNLLGDANLGAIR